MVQHFAGRQDAIDDPHFKRFFRADRVGKQQLFRGLVIARSERDRQARREFRAQSQRHERHREHRIVGAVDEVAVHQHRRADADRRPVDRSHDRLFRQPKRLHEQRHHRLQVGSDRKWFVGRPDDKAAVLRLCELHRLQQAVDHTRTDGVDLGLDRQHKHLGTEAGFECP